MSKLTNSVLEKIQKEHKKPRPKWMFQLKYTALWILVVLSIFFGALFLSSFIMDILHADWSLASRWPGHHMGFIWGAIAWTWIIGISLAIIGGISFFRMTRRGYKYGAILITSFLVIISIFIGISLLSTPFPERMQAWHMERMPRMIHTNTFHNPEEGRLIGEIFEKNGDTAFLTDVNDKDWELWLFDDVFIPMDETLTVFGEQMDEHTFAVTSVRNMPFENFMKEE